MQRANRSSQRIARLGLDPSRTQPLLWVLALTATVAYAKTDPPADPNLAIRVKDHISTQLRKSRLTALPPDSNSGPQYDLEQLMERVKAVQLKPMGRVPGAGETSAAVEPNVASPVSLRPAASTKDRPGEANAAAQASTILTQGLDPNTVTHPFRMAEILYASGHLSQAAPFYQKALAQLNPQDKKTATQRQWILLQLGCCWREDQPAQARQMFSQLMSEYPDSPWLDLARAWQGLADWYLTEQPRRLIQQTPPTSRAGTGR
jgi:tetratricopeptide (TPR) repeat protein